MTDVDIDTFKEKVENGGFGPGLSSSGSLSPFSGRSRSNSRSSLKEKGGNGGRKRSGSRSRSSSCTSLYDDSWVETLDKEDGAAGGLGMGVHGLFERHNVCHSRSKLVTVDVGEHTLEFETQVLNLDRYVAPHLPPSPMKGSPEVSFNGPTVSVEDLEIGNGSQVAAPSRQYCSRWANLP